MKKLKQTWDMQSFFTFIEESPTCFHAVANLQNQLNKAGFMKLNEKDAWKIQADGKYYVCRNDSSLIAFVLPPEVNGGFHITAAHSDSPCFKLKEIPELTLEGAYLKWNVEKYGGMIMSTWMDRPLSVAGRVVVKGRGGMESRLVNLDADMAIIPNVAIHMNRDLNKGIEYNAQTDMQPIVGEPDAKGKYLELLAEKADVSKEEILGTDLFLYNRDKCRQIGLDQSFIAGPRLDDLACAYAGIRALLEQTPKKYINVCVIFDNEEVGSVSKQGADSTFLKDVLARICCGLHIEEEMRYRMIADSFLISADNAHAVHPNHPEKADAFNRPVLNGGIVIKYHGGQRYATDAYSAAVMKDICRMADVPFQVYANRSDIVGGSTLGNISSSQVSVSTVDIGLPQLAMHSAFETAGVKDLEYLVRALCCFYKQ